MNWKKIYPMLIALLVFSTLFSCEKTQVIRRKRQLKDTSLARIVVKRKLVVGVYTFFPPYITYELGNKISGFDVDVAKEVARVLNVDVDFRPLPWIDLVNGLKNKELDCLWGAMSVDNFENIPCIFSNIYMNSSLSTMVLSNSPYKSNEDLKNKPVGLLNLTDSASSALTLSAAMSHFENLQIYSNFHIATDELRRKKISALLLDLFSISQLISNGEKMRMLNEPIYRNSYAVVFNVEDVNLRNRINGILLDLEYKGKLAEISRKWFGSDVLVIGK